MNYKQALDYLYNKVGIKLGLSNTKKLAEAFGNPQLKYDIVHIGGTNGKGTVSTYLAKILENAGYKVGVYNSPHVERFTERVRVNSEEISEEFIIETVERVKGLTHIDSTFFEINTVLALSYFEKMKVDVGILEVGLGGRFDSTNIVNPKLSVITSIAKDHEETLGDTLAKIAFEKGGIIKPEKPVILGDLPDEASEVLFDIARERNSKVLSFGDAFKVELNGDGSFNYTSDSSTLNSLEVSLPGDYTRFNAGLSIAASEFFDRVTEDNIRHGLLNNNILPARYERVDIDGRHLLLDVCHNEAGAKAFVETVKKYMSSYSKVKVLAAMMQNKRYDDMIREFLNLTDDVTLTSIDYARCFDPEDIDESLKPKVNIKTDVTRVLPEILTQMEKGELLCIVGSFYLMEEVRKIIGKDLSGR